MTSLHYTLIVLGVVLVVAVYLYNLFQERRSRKQAERIFGPRHEEINREEDGYEAISMTDLDLQKRAPDQRIEPRIDLSDEGMPEAEHPGTVPRQELQADTEGDDAAETTSTEAFQTGEIPEADAPQADLEPEGPLDGAIEYIARLRYNRPVKLPFRILSDNLRRLSKPIRIFGRRRDGGWEAVSAPAGEAYDTVELSVLLADRSGPVSEVQLETFCRRLYEFAAEHGGAVSCQDRASALEHAETLDAFCAEVDMLIGLNVVPEPGQEFSDQAIWELAGEAGLTQNSSGGFELLDTDGRSLFTLTAHSELLNASNDGAQGLSLLFDVPRVAQGFDAFDRMSNLGFELAERLGGQLVDDGGRPVSHESLSRDRTRLVRLYARMDQHDIPAGGERALRLFA